MVVEEENTVLEQIQVPLTNGDYMLYIHPSEAISTTYYCYLWDVVRRCWIRIYMSNYGHLPRSLLTPDEAVLVYEITNLDEDLLLKPASSKGVTCVEIFNYDYI